MRTDHFRRAIVAIHPHRNPILVRREVDALSLQPEIDVFLA